MLVLTRKEGEKIVIDGHIVVTVVSSHGGKVRLGIDAPRDVKIWREELVDPKLPLPAKQPQPA